MADLPVRSSSGDALPKLIARILQCVEQDGVIAFCIRQTTEKGTKVAERDGDEAVVLCENVDREAGKLVKDNLIRAFYDHPRCMNDILETLNNVRPDAGRSVYLALWYGCTGTC